MSPNLSAHVLLLSLFIQGSSLPAQTPKPSSPQPAASPSTYKTSFDCAKAKDRSVEQAICVHEELATLDVEMAAAYKKRLDSVPVSDRKQLILSQQKWLAIRNSYNVNPYHGDPDGSLADLADFYRKRTGALRSGQAALLEVEFPPEYEWLKAIAPAGFDKGFSIGRAYMTCEDPCKQKPSLYKFVSIGGSGIGEEPGDVDTPYAQIASKLASEGWTECRSADDSGKPTIDYFRKKDKMIAVSRTHSMGAGNYIAVSITTSGPLPESLPKRMPDPSVPAIADWLTYSNPDSGFELRYPPQWGIRNRSEAGTTSVGFGAKDYSGGFGILITPKESWTPEPVPNGEEPTLHCVPSQYQLSGLPAKGCVREYESVGEGICTRYVESLEVETSKYHLTFTPESWGSVVDSLDHYKLTGLYEQILGTIKITESK
jgi:uncharacterized protein YecT (DUF1311 family)